LRAKAVLCPGLTVRLFDEASGERDEWHYQDGLRDYLKGELAGIELLPPELFVGGLVRDTEVVDWAVAWVPDGDLVQESYVNLIPTAQHGTHVNGLRTGFTDALREFCDFRNLLPRGVKARAGRRVGSRGVRAVAEDDRSAVQRPDQGTA
jgi:topoisomerase-4 subunit B